MGTETMWEVKHVMVASMGSNTRTCDNNIMEHKHEITWSFTCGQRGGESEGQVGGEGEGERERGIKRERGRERERKRERD